METGVGEKDNEEPFLRWFVEDFHFFPRKFRYIHQPEATHHKAGALTKE